MTKRKLGIAVVGLGGAVGTTMAAGMSLLRSGAAGNDGLPLAAYNVAGLAGYSEIEFGRLGPFGVDLAAATTEHDVLSAQAIRRCRE